MSNYIDFDSKKSFGYSHHSAKCSLYTSFKFCVLCAAAAYWLQSPLATRFFFILFFSRPRFHCFCTALFLLNHILFITIHWIQHHFRKKKHTFATTGTRDDTFQVCYSRYQLIKATFRGTLYSNTNYTVYFSRPVHYDIILVLFGLFVFGLYIPLFWLPWIRLSWIRLPWITFIQPFTAFFLVILCILY